MFHWKYPEHFPFFIFYLFEVTSKILFFIFIQKTSVVQSLQQNKDVNDKGRRITIDNMSGNKLKITRRIKEI